MNVNKKKLNLLSILLIFVFPVFFSSCVSVISAETQITLYKNEKWNIEVVIEIPKEEVDAYKAYIADNLNQVVYSIETAGGEASWEELKVNNSGNVPYQIEAEGKGYDQINEALFGGVNAFSIEHSGNKEFVRFSVHPYNTIFSSAYNTKFIIKGGKILSSNGAVPNKGVTYWENPVSKMETTFTEKNTNTVTMFIIGGIFFSLFLIIIFIGSIVFLIKNSQKKKNSSVNFSDNRFCPYCGSQFPEEALFCPSCGRK